LSAKEAPEFVTQYVMSPCRQLCCFKLQYGQIKSVLR